LLQCLFYLYKVRRWTSVLCELLWLELNHSKESLLSFIDIWDSANIKWAQWYIKLNVIVHFTRFKLLQRMNERCILYKVWVVWMNDDFFELVNVSSTFQRYINWVLQNFLNEFCSAYVNDILIFTDESLHQHWDHVQRILLWLWEVDLQIDIDKCEFEVKSIKYLKFILKVEKSIQMNSQKMKTIMNWQAFKSVKRVQSFIDFANFYWKFIKNFSNLIMSMMTLIQKNTSFKWTEKLIKILRS
jgi:hypothetical protein